MMIVILLDWLGQSPITMLHGCAKQYISNAYIKAQKTVNGANKPNCSNDMVVCVGCGMYFPITLIWNSQRFWSERQHKNLYIKINQ